MSVLPNMANVKEALQQIPLKLLKVDPKQARTIFGEDEIDALSRSIKGRLLYPIWVCPIEGNGHYRIIAGERRFRAAKIAGLPQILCFVTNRELTEREMLEQQLIDDGQRVNLKPIERARAYQRMMKLMTWTERQLAKALHKSLASITQDLDLLALPDTIQDDVRKGKLAAGSARVISRLSDTPTQMKVAKDVEERRLPQRAVAAIVRREQRKKRVNPRSTMRTFSVKEGLEVIVRSKVVLSERATSEALELALARL